MTYRGQWVIERSLLTGEKYMNYKDIKTFSERCEEHPDHQRGVISKSMMIQMLDQEAQELRKYIERLIVSDTF